MAKQVPNITVWSNLRKSRDRAAAVLDVLWSYPDHALKSRSGHATDELMKKLPLTVIGDRSGKKLMSMSGFTLFMKNMEDAGWIKREINGKRTKSIALVTPPKDWRPPMDNGVEPVPVETKIPEDSAPVAAPLAVVEEPTEDDDAAVVFGGRPGRFAARIERSIPALVEEGVVAGINGWFKQLAIGLGYVEPTINAAEEQLIQRLEQAQEQINTLADDYRAERASNMAAREELNRILRLQYSTRDTTDVRSSELPEAWRALGQHAIKSGWTLHRTGGGHIMWRSPTGFRYFSSSTSSDWRSVRNARSDMEKEGLPKE